MRKLFTVLIAVLLTASMFAQSPQKMSYQAVIRNSSDALVINQSVDMQISILQGTSTGTAVYIETQTPTTNANGLVSIELGGGTVVSGNFSTINWANGPYFIKTEIDPDGETGGITYTITGISQLLSVPYALYAENSGNSIPGLQGPAGSTGATGSQGPVGPIGASGPQGPAGAIGATGPQGSVGSIGATGPQGPVGPIGATGSQGLAGTAGFTHYIGEQFGGGVIFHLFKDNSGVEHGLIVALTVQGTELFWSNDTLGPVGPSARSLWDGLSNSYAIVGQPGHTGSAAKLCLDLVSGGYSDWYLPSIQELNILWSNDYLVARTLSTIAGATQVYYANLWSSTEYNDYGEVWGFFFRDGDPKNYSRYERLDIRAIRAF